MTDYAIIAERLAKRYPNGTEAVRGISFRVRRGEIFGILGPNGAGKSTTMGMLGTLVRPTGGSITVDGFDVVADAREVRRRIGVAMQEVGVDELATGREYLVLQGRLHGLSRGEAAHRAGRVARAGRPRGGRGPAHGRVLGRHEAAGRPRLGARPPAADRVPRRADRGPGPARPQRDLGDARAARRHDGRAHHPLHGGGRSPMRPDRHRRPRPDRRGRRAERVGLAGTST